MKGVQTPRVASYPEYDSEGTKAEKILKLADSLVMPDGSPVSLMPFQESIIRSSCRLRGNKWAAYEVATIMARQNGKSFAGILRVISGLFLFKENIYYSSQELRTTKSLFTQIVNIIKANPELLKRVQGYKPGMSPDDDISGIHRGNGDLQIVTKYGNSLLFGSRSKNSARGVSLNLVILEEAYALTDEEMDAILPTLSGDSMASSPQIWYISSAPLPDSLVLHRIRKRGMSGEARSLLYMEWSAPETTAEEDLYLPETIAQANPAVGYRQDMESLLDEAEGMTVHGYKQERLSIPQVTSVTQLFDLDIWNKQETAPDDSSISPENIVFAIDIPPDRSSACITAAYLIGERFFIEVIDRREGIQWLPHALARLKDQSKYPIVYDAKGHASSLADQFMLLRIPTKIITFDELLRAAGVLFDAFQAQELHHIGQEELSQALAGATVKPTGNRWKYIPSNGGDISPLVASSLAFYFLKSFTSRRKTRTSDTRTQTKRKRRVRI